MKRTAVFCLLGCCACLAAAPSEDGLLRKVMEGQRFIFERAVHPVTHQIYGRVDLDDPNRWERTVFPPPERIAGVMAADNTVPNVCNCAIAGGNFLGLLVDSYDITRSPEIPEQARTVFKGLRTLARVSPRKGFIARCCLPIDNKTHHLNSSVDQYTHYVYGLYKYYHSPMSGEEEKAEMRQILEEICAMIEEDGTILSSDGTPGRVSDIEVIRSDRSSRLLEMFRVGYDLTGNEHWLKLYREKVQAHDHARLRSLLDPKEARHPYVPRDENASPTQITGSPGQTQYSLVVLFESEDDPLIKAVYLESMRMHAEIYAAFPRTSPYGAHIMALAYNRSLYPEIRTAGDEPYRQWLAERIEEAVERNPRSMSAIESYWTAVKRGIINPAAEKEENR